MKFAELDMSHTKYNSRIVQRNSVIFSILMIVTQIGFSIIYGILYKIPSMAINISSVIVTITLAILVVGGIYILNQVLDSSCPIWRDCYGQASALHSL